jgi:hypothetical protein
MTIAFESDNDVIIYALEKVISYARISQLIFVAQCVWWIASIIGLEIRLVRYIDNLRSKEDLATRGNSVQFRKELSIPVTPQPGNAEERQDKILRDWKEYLQESRNIRILVTLKATGETKTGLINPLKSTKESLRVSRKEAKKSIDKTNGIELSEIGRMKSSGECLSCAGPSERKSAHKVKDCIRTIKLDNRTGSFPVTKVYFQQPLSELESSKNETSTEGEDSEEEE